MGFSLDMFFEQLEDIIDDQHDKPVVILAKLIIAIKDAKEYANKCGHLRGTATDDQ